LSDNLRAETPSCRDYADALNDLLAALGIGGWAPPGDYNRKKIKWCFAIS
jgi:hypothetical protein